MSSSKIQEKSPKRCFGVSDQFPSTGLMMANKIIYLYVSAAGVQMDCLQQRQ
jgi:hypothetical protein